MEQAAPNKGKQREEQTYDKPEPPRPVKRARVAVACTRCKSRKQKCDGGQPKCSNCKNLIVRCEYIVPSKSIPHGKYQYIKALEARVAELEGLIDGTGPSIADKVGEDDVFSRGAATDLTGRSPSPVATNRQDSKVVETTQFLKDLSLHAGGGFIGDESSNITVGQIFGAIAHTDVQVMPKPYNRLGSRSQSEQNSPVVSVTSNLLADISRDVADVLLNGYLKHISTRWVVLYRPHIMDLHNKNSREGLSDAFEISTLNLVYAIGGRFLETVGEAGTFMPDSHYEAATEHLSIVLQPHDIASVQTLLLHAIYCLRAPRGLSAWTNVGLAIRICMSLGLHRKTVNSENNLASEIKKRVFWSCYCLDRQVSIILGRPFAISDRDIDAELPLDISDSMSDATIQTQDPSQQSETSTSLSCFVHVIRLRQIESQIQQSIYRVDKHKPLTRSKIDTFLAMLENWRNRAPAPFFEHDTTMYSYDGFWYYEVYYYKSLRLLLYPHLSSPIVDRDLIVRCADACGGVCRSYKSLHRETSVGFSLMAIYSIFLSGLTLLYCLWMSPSTVYSTTTVNDLNACSIVLYIIAERWPDAKRYRDAFETIKQNVLGLIERGPNIEQRTPLPGLANPTLRDLGNHGFNSGESKEYSRMMNEMTNPSQNRQVYGTMQPPDVHKPRPRAMSDQTSLRYPTSVAQISPRQPIPEYFQTHLNKFQMAPMDTLEAVIPSSSNETLSTTYYLPNESISSMSVQQSASQSVNRPPSGSTGIPELYQTENYPAPDVFPQSQSGI